MLKGKRVLVCITGGIALYKVVNLVSMMIKKEVVVEILMTEAATKLVSPLLFETIGRCKVHTDMFHTGHHCEVEHIEIAARADIVLVAPATANTIAKVSYGIADNLLTSTLLAYPGQVIFAPSMNTNMLNNPSTQENIKRLKDRGHKFIDSCVGELACNTFGDGRLAEPEDIIDYLESFVTIKDLKGKKILIGAGPTVERIDPVRYITNDSSGKMGYAIAKRCLERGADVVLVSGPTNIKALNGIRKIGVESTQEMLDTMMAEFSNSDGVIMAAAPCDYKPLVQQKDKIKKNDDNINIALIENPDIIANMGMRKDKQVLIGFAAETSNLLENAKKKLAKKNLDYVVANDVTLEGAGFNVDTNIISIVSKDSVVEYPLMKKIEIADIILDLLVKE